MKTAVVLIFTLGAWVRAADDCVIAETEFGLVCGARKKATNGDDFVSFLGIRYAKPPLGELRFAEPQNPDPHDGIFDATTPGLICPQTDRPLSPQLENPPMGEDCLRINIHVPLASLPDGPDRGGRGKPLLPVLVFIHGGSFAAGSGNPDVHGPEYLITKGIVIVTFNYRLSAIGFLSMNSKYIPGNAGLRDCFFALKWVKRNIRFFGGDPEEITLGGLSAGGALAHLLSISPATQGLGLFKRGIYLSGVGIGNFFSISPLYPKILSLTFLQGMGISSFRSAKTIHQELINAPIEKILEAQKYVQNRTGIFLFAPVVETPRAGFTTMLPKDPEDLLTEGYGKDITTLFGFANNECQAFKKALIDGNLQKILRTVPVLIVPQNLLFTSNALTIPVLTMKVSSEYFNSSLPTLEKFLPLCNDGLYKYPALRSVDKRLAVGAAPTYIYEFGYHGEVSVIRQVLMMDWPGAAHSEDLPYFFRPNLFYEIMKPDKEVDELAQPDPDSRMRLWMTTFIANFVKTGSPSSNPSAWQPAGPQLEYQSIEEPMQYKFQPAYPYLREKKKFFDKLYKIGRVEVFG